MTVPLGYHFTLEMDEVEYPLVCPDPRSYHFSDISSWTQRQTLGALSLASQDQQNAFEQRSFHGGLGQLEMKEASAYRMAHNVDTRVPGHLTLYSHTYDAEGIGSTGLDYYAYFGEFDGANRILHAGGDEVRLFTGTSTIIDITGSFSGTATSVFYNGMYFFVGRESDSVVRLTGSTGAPTWTEISSSSANHPKDVTTWAIHNGFVWTNQNTNGTCNLLHYAGQSNLADLEGNTSVAAHINHPEYDVGGDGKAVEVGPYGRSVKALCSYDGKLYAFRVDGIWVVDTDNTLATGTYSARKLVDYSSDISEDNFNCVQIWNGAIWFNVRNRIFRYTGGSQVEITPRPEVADYPPPDRQIISMTADRDNLYVIMLSDTLGYTLFSGNGSVWQMLVSQLDSDGPIKLVNYEAADVNLRQLVGACRDLSGVAKFLYWDTTIGYSYDKFAEEGYLWTSKFDGGFMGVPKKWHYVNVLVHIPEDCYIVIDAFSYEDGDVTQYQLGTLTADVGDVSGEVDGTEVWNRTLVRLPFPPEARGKELDFRITLHSDGSSNLVTPVFYGYTLAYVIRPPTIMGYAIRVRLHDNMINTIGSFTGKTALQMMQFLERARDSVIPLRFQDFLGHSAYVYPSSIRGDVIEVHPADIGQPERYELEVAMSLIEIERNNCVEAFLSNGTTVTGNYVIPCLLNIEGTVTFA